MGAAKMGTRALRTLIIDPLMAPLMVAMGREVRICQGLDIVEWVCSQEVLTLRVQTGTNS